MVDYREILRLNSLKYTQRQIAASVHSSRNTISEVLINATIRMYEIDHLKMYTCEI